MTTQTVNQRTIALDDHLETWIEAFLIDRQAQNLAPGTLYFYRKKLALFTRYCDAQVITHVSQIIPSTIRDYLLWLSSTKHNPGGIHACYRAVKTFLLWYWAETELGTPNPIARVKAPRLSITPLDPASLDTIGAMLSTCDAGFTGARDRAIILTLLDTGIRSAELIAVDIADLKLTTGAIYVRQGKGRKPRTVYIGQTTRRAMRAYLRRRTDDSPALWVTDEFERLTYWGLREIIRRRAARAGIPAPTLHSFRRAFALAMLRAGVDIYTLQDLMGHADIQVLRRYLKLVDTDLQIAHRRGSPVDKTW